MKASSSITWIVSLAVLALISSSCTKFNINNRCCENGVDTITAKYTLPDSFRLYIPQAFTPNGDGLNEFFQPYGTNFEVEYFEIRRGRAVMYQSDDYLEAFWDGRDHRDETEAKDGRYTYHMTLRLSNRERLEVKGDVCVMRFGEVGDNLYEDEREKVCECIMPDMIDPRKGVVSETPECPTNAYTD